MNPHSFILAATLVLGLSASTAWAKLPSPVLDDAAKAKAAEAAAKAAHGGKIENFLLCKSMDRVAAAYFAQARKDGKTAKPAEASAAACTDPGPFVYTPPPASGAAPAAVATAPAAAPKK